MWSANLQQSRKECPMEKKTVSSANGAGKTGQHMQKNETGPLSYTTHKNKLKMDKEPECEKRNHQIPRGEHTQQPL